MKNKKISKILIGTNNRGKPREIANLLPKKVKVFSTKDFNLKRPNETGKTFKSNALIKAKYFSKKTNLICLSDDSGLEIDILKKNQEFIQLDGEVKKVISIKQCKGSTKN